MFENKTEEILPRSAFLLRLLRSFGVTVLILAVSLGIGSAGYHYFENMHWIDALLNATMILTGMGPAEPKLGTDGGKLFATFYALYSGIAFLSIMAVLLAPVFHRALHKFHLDDEGD